MQDLFDEENPPGEIERRTGPHGPTTLEGKAKSSMNRLDHGCCSEKTVLPDEDPAEFDHCINSWFTQYQPDNASDTMLVQETARACWFFKRASKRLEECEYRLPGDAHHWTEEHHKRYANFSRYKTTNERSFLRFYKELQARCDKALRDDQVRERALIAALNINMLWLRKQEEKAAENLKIQQWVEVEVIDGKCKTSYYPPNRDVIKKAAEQNPHPVFLSRFIDFPNGVPPEYAWTRPSGMQQVNADTAVQKMSYNHWLELIESEKAVRPRRPCLRHSATHVTAATPRLTPFFPITYTGSLGSAY